MTTTATRTLEDVEQEARRSTYAHAYHLGLTVYDTDSSTSPNFTRPGYLYSVNGEFVSRDEAACYLQGCGVLCPVHGDVRDTSVVR